MSTTEELKREMYKSLANLKGRIEINYSIKDALHGVDDLEGALEEYLEALRLDRDDLECRLAQMTEERDDIQLRLHAVDHAYNEQQRSPALEEVLKHNKALIKTVSRQRQYIRTLYTSRKARKPRPSTMAQRSGENASGVELKRLERHSPATCAHRWTQLESGASLVCRECLVIADVQPRLQPVVD